MAQDLIAYPVSQLHAGATLALEKTGWCLYYVLLARWE
jgi:hypothetical protein